MWNAVFRITTRIHAFLYRLSGGLLGGAVIGLRILLLTSQGRKTGSRRTTPLGYFMDGDDYVIIASNSGQDRHPGWYLNLQAHPEASIQVGRQTIRVNAETAGPADRGRLWTLLLQKAPGYRFYERRTRREIPVVVLHAAG